MMIAIAFMFLPQRQDSVDHGDGPSAGAGGVVAVGRFMSAVTLPEMVWGALLPASEALVMTRAGPEASVSTTASLLAKLL